jgi:hypothetical protein
VHNLLRVGYRQRAGVYAMLKRGAVSTRLLLLSRMALGFFRLFQVRGSFTNGFLVARNRMFGSS